MRTAIVLTLLLAGCAGTADLALPATAIKVSTACAALQDIPEAPVTTPDDTLKALGIACETDPRSCARFVYLMSLDRSKLIEWSRLAGVGIQSCK